MLPPLLMIWQLDLKKKNFEFKQLKNLLHLKIDLVSHPACGGGVG